MTSFYSSITSTEGDMLNTAYIQDQKLSSYPLSELPDNKVYPSAYLSYQTLLSDNLNSAHDRDHETNIPPRYSDGLSQYNALSLSLGSQYNNLNHYTNYSLCSLISSNVVQSEDQLSGKTMLSLNNSQYLKAAQDLLDEVVSVESALKSSEKGINVNSLGQDAAFELHESTIASSHDLLPCARHDLQSQMMKLLSMLDEVDRRYKQYFNQMQVLVSSFDTLAGQGAAKTYTVLALKTISCQFRCLRDAIKKEIEIAQKSLGDKDSNSGGQGIFSRLRYVDQELRQRKALQQFGIRRQRWRPQRGLPESAVSVLRAWLFEHFLNPYPKESEKLVLARQTGLTRSQVANWFINARVRLWKPMIEEMYKELEDAENEPESSPEHVTDARVGSRAISRDMENMESYYTYHVNNHHRFDMIPG